MSLPVMSIDGDVVAVHSHWTQDGSRIVTEATVRTPDGSEVVVSQLGGTVDGIAMRTMPGPELLTLGMKVAVAAHRDVDLARTEHIVLDSAKVIAYPPGYVRTGPTDGKHFLRWESGCVFVAIDGTGTVELDGDSEFDIVDAAISTWNNDTASCSYLTVMNEGPKLGPNNAPLEVGRDNVNLIKFRDTHWGRPAIGDDAARDYQPAAAGITTAVYINDPKSDRDGVILDADIELNGVNFAISAEGASSGSAGCRSDLQNTLTHELGHLHGLEHPCRVGNDPARVDGEGHAVPTCAEVQAFPLMPANQKILAATMYNFQDCGEIDKSTLSQDDVDAICAIYPKADDPGDCERVSGKSSGGCCSASLAGDRPDVAFLLAGTTVLLVMRRRRGAAGR